MPVPSFLSNRCCSLPFLWIQWARGVSITYSPLLLPNNCPSAALSTLFEAHLNIYVPSHIFITVICCPLGRTFPRSSVTLAPRQNLLQPNTCHHIFLELCNGSQQLGSTAATLHSSISQKSPSSRLWSLHFPPLAAFLLLPLPVSPLLYLIFFLPSFCQQSAAS